MIKVTMIVARVASRFWWSVSFGRRPSSRPLPWRGRGHRPRGCGLIRRLCGPWRRRQIRPKVSGMWANTCWSLFGIAITLALAMIGLPPEYVWLQPWFLGTSVFCFAASILCFSWPLWIQSPNPTLLQAQIAAFDRVQQFFGGLDEAGLKSGCF
jgi:hypothetical protein